MIDVDQVARAKAADIGRVASAAGLRLRKVGRELIGGCPRCGGTDRFSVHLGKGVFFCRGCRATGNTISLVMFLTGLPFARAVETLTGGSRAAPASNHGSLLPPSRSRADDDDTQRNLALADTVCREALPIADADDGKRYFTGRGIEIDDVPDGGGLWFHPQCPWQRGTAPCIIARFTDILTCEPRGIHRRPIAGGKPRSLGPTTGCAIRLWPDDWVETALVIGEGCETTLAAATRIEHRGTLLRPAWACGSAGGIAKFPVLAGIESLTILADNDANGAGQRAAGQCAERWAAAGREVTILIPDDLGADFNDLVHS
jgi:phage/plasmid primase-like uncharacterized protein